MLWFVKTWKIVVRKLRIRYELQVSISEFIEYVIKVFSGETLCKINFEKIKLSIETAYIIMLFNP